MVLQLVRGLPTEFDIAASFINQSSPSWDTTCSMLQMEQQRQSARQNSTKPLWWLPRLPRAHLLPPIRHRQPLPTSDRTAGAVVVVGRLPAEAARRTSVAIARVEVARLLRLPRLPPTRHGPGGPRHCVRIRRNPMAGPTSLGRVIRLRRHPRPNQLRPMLRINGRARRLCSPNRGPKHHPTLHTCPI